MSDMSGQPKSFDPQSPSAEPEPQPFRAVDEVLGDTVLRKFVGTNLNKLEYYRRAFQTILERTELQGRSLEELSPAIIRKAFRKANLTLFRARIPFTRGSIFNWAAFFFNCYWLVWRKANSGWRLLALFIIVTLLAGFIPSAVFTTVTLSIAVIGGQYGNQFLLRQLLDELRTGKVRTKPTSIRNVIVAVLIALTFAIFGTAVGEAQTTTPNSNASKSSSKIDVLEIAPGMPIAEANVISSKWSCGPGYTMNSGPNYACAVPGGRIYVLWGGTTKRVFQVEFDFDAGGEPDDVVRSIGRQFNADIRRQTERNPFAFRTYKTSLRDGVELEINVMPSGPGYRMKVFSPAVRKADEVAAQLKDQQQRPAPRF